MTTVPASVSENCRVHGLQLLRQGKVRDTYSLPDHPGHLLVVATDRVSIFDHVLAAE
ncbi:TPA: hypothetical protein DCZ32_00750, partial [Candidatus Uhrbacteria bacterium]|nr:hypothetical protein [Candidatus Uhrbacteria bacterium]